MGEKREYCKALTKEMLIEYGFIEPEYRDGVWVIKRKWHSSGRSKTPQIKEIKITKAVGKHKYTKPKEYLKISFSYNSKTMSIPLSRFLYVWFVEDLPQGYDCEHKNNDPFDNRIENLTKSTRKENLAKRFIDNPNSNHNQWEALNKNS